MKKKCLALLACGALILSLAACGGSPASGAGNSAANDSAQASDAQGNDAQPEALSNEDAAPGDAGFTEIPIFEDEEVGFMNVSAVYFQPVPMSNGNESIEDFDLHLECDISAMENNLGYGPGDWVPYLTIDYAVTGSNGEEAASGTFMPMAASDGPHYGANIALPNADTYSLSFTFHSPEENGYLVHTDAETGPGGTFDDYFADGNLTVTYDGWDYVPQEW